MLYDYVLRWWRISMHRKYNLTCMCFSPRISESDVGRRFAPFYAERLTQRSRYKRAHLCGVEQMVRRSSATRRRAPPCTLAAVAWPSRSIADIHTGRTGEVFGPILWRTAIHRDSFRIRGLSLRQRTNEYKESAVWFLLRDADMHSAYLMLRQRGWLVGWVARWLSVTRRYCINTAKPILNFFRPSGSPIILVSTDPCADTQFQGEPLQRGVKYTDGGKNWRFSCDFRRWLLWNVNRKSCVPDWMV